MGEREVRQNRAPILPIKTVDATNRRGCQVPVGQDHTLGYVGRATGVADSGNGIWVGRDGRDFVRSTIRLD